VTNVLFFPRLDSNRCRWYTVAHIRVV